MSEVRCPSCELPLRAGAAQCAECDLPLTGPVAARLWQLDQDLARLGHERRQLLQLLRSQQTAPAVAARPGPGASAEWSGAPPVTAATGSSPGWTGQRVLLGAGVALVLVAAVVFLAVAWSLIGVAGQVAVMLAGTAAVAAVTLRLSGRGLRQSAEALGVLTAGLLLVDVAGARSLGLAGLDAVDGRAFGVLAGVLVALVLATLHTMDVRVRAFAVTAVIAASGAWLAAMGWATGSALTIAAGALLGAGVFAAAAAWMPSSLRTIRTAAAGPASGWLAIGVVAALDGAFAPPRWAPGNPGLSFAGGTPIAELRIDEAAAIGLLLTVGVATSWLTRRLLLARGRAAGAGPALPAQWARAPFSRRWRTVSMVAASATVTLPGAVVAVGWQLGAVASAMVAGLGAALVAALFLRWRRRGGAGAWAALMGFLVIAGAGVAAASWESATATAVAAAALSAAATSAAVARPRLRSVMAALALLGGTVAAGLGGGQHSAQAAVACLTVTAVAAVGLGAVRRGHGEEVVLAGMALVPFLLAAGSAAVPGWPRTLAGVLTVLGLCAVAYAQLPGRDLLVPVAVPAVAGAAWVLLADAGVDVVEAYSLSLATCALAAGLWLRARRRLASWASVGVAVTTALLPSALMSLADEGITRPLLTLVAAAAVLVAGVMARWQAPVVVGAAAVALAAFSQLAPYAVGAPRWLTLGSVGALLLVVGARYERRRADVRALTRWVSALG